jgi:23S rRNA (cytidine1920-2'-O)/16S rRNA (cytidine1409-2'-O)-methyltransferase
MATQRVRLDQLVVDRGLASSRERAQLLIRSGVVFAGTSRLDKPGTLIHSATTIEVRADPCPFVSRGGLKLDAALQAFGVSCAGRTAVDVGASTGGFTDCLLQRGAEKVFALDVGRGQLDAKLRADPRVRAEEKCNVRHLAQDSALWQEIAASGADLAVFDVSFISLALVLGPLAQLMGPAAEFICLVKPQFEVGPKFVGKGGVVRDDAARLDALSNVSQFAERQLGFAVGGSMECPVAGAKGNREWLLWLRGPAR